MRISGGAARGINLFVPPGNRVRPATDGLRQAVFSSLGPRIEGARFLDLFAGSGAYGLEALSRGAAGGTWVEHHRETFDLMRRNVAAVCRSLGRDTEGLTMRRGDACAVPWDDPAEPPDIIFVDPPYAIIAKMAPRLFARLGRLMPGHQASRVVFEMPGEVNLAPGGWDLVKRLGKGTGQPTVAIFRPGSVDSDRRI